MNSELHTTLEVSQMVSLRGLHPCHMVCLSGGMAHPMKKQKEKAR